MGGEDRGLVSRVGPVEVDWPRALGYFGGIALATALELIEPPLAIFIAAVPFVRMLNVPNASWPVRFIAQVTDGAAKPVGGDSEQTVRLTTPDLRSAARRAKPAPRSTARSVAKAAETV